MSLHTFDDARLGLERFTELGISIRRRATHAAAAGTLVYIHGLGESGLCFESVLCDSRLDSWQHVAPDLLGYGRSAWPAEPLDLEGHAASLERLIEHLGLDDVVLVGHSMGGVIALLMAERGNVGIRFILDLEGNVTLEDCGFSSIAARFELPAWLEGGYGAFVERIHHLANEGEADSSRDHADILRADILRAYGASAHFADPRTLWLDSVDLVRQSGAETLAARRGALEVPSAYVYGSPRGTGEKSRGQLRDAGIETFAIEPAGHWPFLDQHDAFLELMADLLERRARRARRTSPGVDAETL